MERELKFESHSLLFAPKPHGNAFYAGYIGQSRPPEFRLSYSLETKAKVMFSSLFNQTERVNYG